MDKYIETLKKLYIKGIINEDELKEKYKMYKMKNPTNFEKQVELVIQEVVDDGYIKKTIERIFQENKK